MEEPAMSWLAHDTYGLGKIPVGDKDSDLPECVAHVLGGGEHAEF